MQFRHAFQRAAAILTAAGLDFTDVVEMTTYHVHLQEPAWTAVGVTELARPGALIEVKVTARLRS